MASVLGVGCTCVDRYLCEVMSIVDALHFYSLLTMA